MEPERCSEKAVSPSYVALLLAIKHKVDRGECGLLTYYALFPSGDVAVQPPWDVVVRETCASLANERVLHTPAGGGAWISPRDATFPDHEVERDRALRDALIEEGVLIPDTDFHSVAARGTRWRRFAARVAERRAEDPATVEYAGAEKNNRRVIRGFPLPPAVARPDPVAILPVGRR